MARQLKRWESPRREGRNDKGRGGAARKRQRQKQLKNLMKKLKQQDDRPNYNNSDHNHRSQEGREKTISSLLCYELNRQASLQPAELYLALQFYGVLRSTATVNRSIAAVNFS